MSYIPPLLPEPPHYSPSHRGSRVGQILAIAVVVALGRARPADSGPAPRAALSQQAGPSPATGVSACEVLPVTGLGATWSPRDALFMGRRSGKGMMNAPRDLPIHRPEIQPDRRHTGRRRELNIETAPSKPTVKV